MTEDTETTYANVVRFYGGDDEDGYPVAVEAQDFEEIEQTGTEIRTTLSDETVTSTSEAWNLAEEELDKRAKIRDESYPGTSPEVEIREGVTVRCRCDWWGWLHPPAYEESDQLQRDCPECGRTITVTATVETAE